MNKKRFWKWTGGGLLFVFLYLLFGALVPFVIHQRVETGDSGRFQSVGDFYGEDLCGDRAGVVESNEDALNLRLMMFREAKERIVISTFDIREGESTSDCFAFLLEAANRGVRVQILVDGLSGMLHMNGKSIFSTAGSHPNIEIRFYNPINILKPWTFNGRLHDKYIIVDDKLLLAGGRNMFDYFLGDYPGKRRGTDREVFIYNTLYEQGACESVISQADSYFQEIWAHPSNRTVFESPPKDYDTVVEGLAERCREAGNSGISGIEEERCMEITVPVKKTVFLTNPVNILAKRPYIWHWLKELIKDGGNTFIQSPYVVLSKDMYSDFADICEYADVTVLINSVVTGDNFAASSDYIYNREKVLDTGVTVLESFGQHSSHSKSLLIGSSLSVIGSYNLDMRSTYVDTETMVVIHGDEFYQELQGHMMNMAEESLEADRDEGGYRSSTGAGERSLPVSRKILFAISSRFIQLVRFLV